MSTSESNEENNEIKLDLINKKLFICEYVLEFEHNVEVEEKWKLKAKEIFGETPEIMERAKQELIQLIKDEEDFFFPTDRDHLLLCYLRPCRYDVEKAFKFIRRHFLFRLKNPHLVNDLLPSVVREPFKQNIVSFFPYRDHEGRRIMYVKGGKNWITSKCSTYEILRAIMLFGETFSYETLNQINGGLVLCDMHGFTFDKIFSFTPKFAKTLVDYVQKASPMDVHGIHFINQPKIFGAVFAIFKPLINERYRNRIYFHGTMNESGQKSLMKYIDSRYLPTWLGGQAEFPDNYSLLLSDLCCEYEHLHKEINTWGYTTYENK